MLVLNLTDKDIKFNPSPHDIKFGYPDLTYFSGSSTIFRYLSPPLFRKSNLMLGRANPGINTKIMEFLRLSTPPFIGTETRNDRF